MDIRESSMQMGANIKVCWLGDSGKEKVFINMQRAKTYRNMKDYLRKIVTMGLVN